MPGTDQQQYRGEDPVHIPDNYQVKGGVVVVQPKEVIPEDKGPGSWEDTRQRTRAVTTRVEEDIGEGGTYIEREISRGVISLETSIENTLEPLKLPFEIGVGVLSLVVLAYLYTSFRGTK